MRKELEAVGVWGILLLLAFSSACVPVQKSSAGSIHLSQQEGISMLTAADLADTDWILKHYGPVSEPSQVLTAPEVTLHFDPDLRIRGMAGCNTYAAQTELDGYRFTHTRIAHTPFGCPDEATWRQETYLLEALATAKEIGLKDGRLAINYEGGQLLFSSRSPVPNHTLEGTAWSLIFFQGETSNQPLIPGSQITAEFKDGTIVGTTGCNGYTGAYETKDSDFTMWQVVMTAEACQEERNRDQEAAYIAALHSAHSFTIANQTLTVAFDGGALRFGAMPPANELVLSGTTWQLSTAAVAGISQPLLEGTQITVAFGETKVYGSSGCNQFEASYQEGDASTLTISQLGATQRDCGQPIMRQESDFLRFFRQVDSLDFQDTDLQLKLVAGSAELLFLPHSTTATSTTRPLGDSQPAS